MKAGMNLIEDCLIKNSGKVEFYEEKFLINYLWGEFAYYPTIILFFTQEWVSELRNRPIMLLNTGYAKRLC